jgi:exopolyphosphatase/guanosine-5'-triphosphate,3'-diphosphate pyrophosphatase
VARSLELLAATAPEFGVPAVPTRAVATQVLRMAADPEAFTAAAREAIGVEIEIIDGDEEARLVFCGGTLGLEAAGPWIVVDIGGQSTELCRGEQGGALEPLSVLLGVVGLTERFFTGDPPGPEEIAALERFAAAVIAEVVPADLDGELLAVAGTATALGALEACPGEWRRAAIHGITVSRERLRHWRDVMLAMPTAERTRRYGIGRARADVFPAGLMLLDAVLARLGRERLRVSVNGLRVGAALSILER